MSRRKHRRRADPYGQVAACSHCKPRLYGRQHGPKCPNRPDPHLAQRAVLDDSIEAMFRDARRE